MVKCVSYVLSFAPRPAGGVTSVRCRAGRIQALQLKCGRCKYKVHNYLVTPAETYAYATTLQEHTLLF